MAKALFQLEPFTCPSCIKKIETELNKTDGIDSSKVLFNIAKVKVEFDETKVQAGELEKKISKLGFAVLSTKLND